MARDPVAPDHLMEGDCRTILPTLDASSVDSIVTDPPYELGFMGREWDRSGIAFDVSMWKACLRVLKPGGYMLAMGGTRTHHRLMCAIEDARFEIRDCLMWLYGTGFPKGKACLKPAWEPIVLARKPGGRVSPLGIDACRVPGGQELEPNARPNKGVCGGYEVGMTGAPRGAWTGAAGRWPANVLHDGSDEVMEAFAAFGGKGGGFGIRGGDGGGVMAAQGVNKMHRARRKDLGAEVGYGDTGTAARFFYCAKASKSERGTDNNHPTVKPLALVRWMVRLVTPPGGRVLDPFAGSGTTLLAAQAEGAEAVGIEESAAHCEIIRRRLANAVEDRGLFAEAS